MKRCVIGRCLVVICASVTALSAAPAAASACASPTKVKSYHGGAQLGFDAQNSGSDTGNGGTYSAELKRHLTGLNINLTHKLVTQGHVVFTGKASGGSVSVDDSYSDTGAQVSGHETYGGGLPTSLPNYGTATLVFNLASCKYQLTVGFGVVTTISGSFDSGSHVTVTGQAYGEREHIPANLKIVGGAGPPAYVGGCPGNPLKSGQPCYRFGGGVVGLCGTSDVGTSHCPASGDTVGSASFIWILKPKFAKPPKKKK